MMLKISILSLAATLAFASPSLAEFSFTFDWKGLKLCTTGQPNTVANPRFKLRDVPDGTTYVQFKLKDLDVPGYNHGGGWIEVSADGTVPANAFTYQSPCPPSGSHDYEWTATARTKKGGGKKLAVAKSRRAYPE